MKKTKARRRRQIIAPGWCFCRIPSSASGHMAFQRFLPGFSWNLLSMLLKEVPSLYTSCKRVTGGVLLPGAPRRSQALPERKSVPGARLRDRTWPPLCRQALPGAPRPCARTMFRNSLVMCRGGVGCAQTRDKKIKIPKNTCFPNSKTNTSKIFKKHLLF